MKIRLTEKLIKILLAAALSAAAAENFGQMKPTKLPPLPPNAADEKSGGQTDWAKDFDLQATVTTDEQGAISSGDFSVTKAGGDAAALKMTAAAIDFLSRAELPPLLRKAGFGREIEIRCSNIWFARPGEFNLILSTPETSRNEKPADRAQLDLAIDEMFARQKSLPAAERFLISPVGVLSQKSSLNLTFRISIARARRALARREKIQPADAARGLLKTVNLFLEEPPPPPGVYAEISRTEKNLYLDRRRAELLESRFFNLAGADLLDFQKVYRELYFSPESAADSPGILDSKLAYANEEAQWLLAVSIFYSEAFDEAKRAGKNTMSEAEMQELFAPIFSDFADSDKTPPTGEERLRQISANNDETRRRLREFYDRYSFAREGVAHLRENFTGREAALAADLRARPQAARPDGKPQISQTYDSNRRRCTEKGCEKFPPTFAFEGLTIVYDERAKDFKVLNYELKFNRLF